MITILAAVSQFGLPTVAAVVLIFILARGELVFRYPRRQPQFTGQWCSIPSLRVKKPLHRAR
jgi:hypothetical protein